MKKTYQRKRLAFLLCILCFITIILYAVLTFEQKAARINANSKYIELQKTAELNGKNIQAKYISMLNALTTLADRISQVSSGKSLTDDKSIFHYVEFLASLDFFDYVGVSNPDGLGVDSSGRRVNIHDRNYFKEAMDGNIFISDVMASKVIEGDDVQIISVPVVKNELCIGVIFGIVNIETLSSSLETITGNLIQTQIIDSSGNLVTRLKTKAWQSEYNNVWDYYDHAEFLTGSISQLRADISALRSGYCATRFQGRTRVSYYAPLGIGSYYIYSNFDALHLKKQTEQINRLAVYMSIQLAAAFAILLLSIYLFNRKIYNELNSSYKSVVNSEEILRLAAMHSDMFIFEYDTDKNILNRKAGNGHLLFPEQTMTHIPSSVLRKDVLNPAFDKAFSDTFQKIRDQESVSVTVQTTARHQAQWFQILMKNIYDEKRHIINTIGIVKNISDVKFQEELTQKEKRGKEKFQSKAERDGLTGLYNITTAAEKIDKILSSFQRPDEKHIFVLMDLDNFKQINDTFGHPFGNDVLIEISGILSAKFRRNDIVARLGGDEFAVFLPFTQGFEKVEHLFRELVDECSKTYEKDGVSVQVSASFGISVALDHGSTFEELSRKADEMLYLVKKESKCGYRLYGS